MSVYSASARPDPRVHEIRQLIAQANTTMGSKAPLSIPQSIAPVPTRMSRQEYYPASHAPSMYYSPSVYTAVPVHATDYLMWLVVCAGILVGLFVLWIARSLGFVGMGEPLLYNSSSTLQSGESHESERGALGT